MVQVVPALWRVHLCRLSRVQDLRSACACPLVVCSLLLSALSLCSWCVACKYGSISRFKGVFRGFWGCCVGLCGLRALRGLCGFCVRERLGGLKACGVFAFVFLSFPLCLPFVFPCSSSGCPSLLWLSFFVLLHCLCGSLGVVVVSFSLAVYTQKRAQFSCVLSWCVVGLFISP